MNNTHLLGPGTVVSSFGPSPTVVEDAGILWEGERILEVGAFGELSIRHSGAQLLNAHGGIILPGLVNLHHHFYSALARGLDPGVRMADFSAILKGLWWRLDRALDEEAVRLSAALSLAECIRTGCTTVFDHHASPSFIRGSLDLIAEEVSKAGLSAVLCYEISDRNSHQEALRGLEENLEFAASCEKHPRLRGLLGLHASFTLSEETLRVLVERRSPDLGIHVHLCEDAADRRESLRQYGKAPLERFDALGLLDRNALLIHGVDLEEGEYERIGESGATLVHNPESNANNAVGSLDLGIANRAGCRLGLGTDGMSSAMLRALRAAFLNRRASTADPSLGFEVIPKLPENNAERAAAAYGIKQLGRLEKGAPADFIVVDAPPPTPLDGTNFFGHLIYGLSEAGCRHTIARGRILLRDFRHTELDVEKLAAEAREVSPALWERFGALSVGDA